MDLLTLAASRADAAKRSLLDLARNPREYLAMVLNDAAERARTAGASSEAAMSVMPEVRDQANRELTDLALNTLGGGLVGKIGKAEEAAAAAGKSVSRSKRTVGTTGQYVGAPPGVDSPAKFNNLINGYVERISEALDNGVPRDYFYARGREANTAVTRDAAERSKLALLEGITSSEAPVALNTSWAIKGLEQDAMGAPIATGMYPNASREKVTQAVTGQNPYVGPKTHRYAVALDDEAHGLAPNDRWEFRSLGYDKSTATPQQHDFTDEVRQRAVERWNAKHPDQAPLSLIQGQELNWATQRARDMGISHIEAASDTIQDALKAATFQHSWESRGGAQAKHMQDMPLSELPRFHERIKEAIVGPEGRDKLVDAMGGRLQFPAVDGPGVYQGFVAPGTQSRSLIYQTNESGLDPTSAARVNATEAARALFLGQDAYAGHAIRTPKKLTGPQTDVLDVKLGRVITEDEATKATQRVNEVYGFNDKGEPNAGIVPTEDGFRILRFNENPKFAKTFAADIAPQLQDLVGAGSATGATRQGSSLYGALDWAGGNATRDFLATLDNPAAPKLSELADSQGMRAIAADLAEAYAQNQHFGPNPKLLNLLRVFSEQGLPGMRDLVAKGLAPSLATLGLYGMLRPGEPQDLQ
jgi:hypothetical protein